MASFNFVKPPFASLNDKNKKMKQANDAANKT